MSDARLRRLDALFAEMVMGHTIQPAHRGLTAYDDGPPVVVGESATGDFGCLYGPIPRYTRSLDAAWLSPPLFDIGVWHLSVVTQEGPCGPYRGLVTLERSDQPGGSTTGAATASHPAEALVLACLRAVGCTEDELA